MSPEQIASILDQASRVAPVSTPLLALIAAVMSAAALVLHAVAAYRNATKTPPDVRLPPPELPK